MFALHRFRLPTVLRMFVAALLVFGLLAKPMLAVGCDIGDARLALAGEHQAATQGSDAGASDDCCPAQDCNECCAPTATLPAVGMTTSSQVNASPLSTLSVKFAPTAYPVGFRPPIAG